MIVTEKIFETPQFNEKLSAWVEHIPFAFYLTDVLQPHVFVELGTHYGVSYFAFCQAIKDDSIPCKSFAVDHWQGDEHAGFYGENVFEYVSEINQKHFQEFSTLLKMSFEDAVNQIEDNTIDLLHIDGMHSYEAVKNDFETWLPKMSDSGVVLFHDTQVRDNDFGVWKIFGELKDQYPSFEFEHGYGLGLLCVGSEYNRQLLTFIETAKENPFIAELFASTGQKHSLEFQYKSLKKALKKEVHGVARLFHKSEDEDYSERKSFTREVNSKTEEFAFKLNNPAEVKSIRFDPLNSCAVIKLRSIELFINNSPIERSYSISANALRVDNGTFLFAYDDPQIELNFTSEKPIKIDEVRIQVDYIQKPGEIIRELESEINKKATIKSVIRNVKGRFKNR